MNFRMSCVVIFLALCLMNVHSLSEGSKGNDTSTGQLKEFQKYFTEKPEEMKKFSYWRAMQQKKQANETTHELMINKTTKPVLKSSSKEKLSTRPLSTPTILSEISTKPVTQKPNPPTSKTTKSVADTSKPSTKIPSSREKSPTSKTATSKSVTEIPSKPSTKTPTSKPKSPTSKIMTTKSEAETTRKHKTKTRTTKQKSPTSKTTTAKNVTDIPSNSSTKNATTTGMTKDGNVLPSSKTKQAESITDQFGQRSHFGVIFMVILVVIVAVYFGYHNRNKIHKFIKRGFSTSKHIGPGYLKVKLEDDIDLPREANRQYIY